MALMGSGHRRAAVLELRDQDVEFLVMCVKVMDLAKVVVSPDVREVGPRQVSGCRPGLKGTCGRCEGWKGSDGRDAAATGGRMGEGR